MENKANSVTGMSSGNDTKDYIFVPSEEEVDRYYPKQEVIINNGYYYPNVGSEAAATGHTALLRSIKASEQTSWMLRTAGLFDSEYSCICDGFVSENTSDTIEGIRPCFWLDLKNACVAKK